MSAESCSPDPGPSAGLSYDLAATTFKKLHPTTFLRRFLDSGIREDGRQLTTFRSTSISVGGIATADGSCLVRMGSTTVIAAIKAEIAQPHLARPQEGYVIPNVELSPISSGRFKPGPPTDEAQVLTDTLLTFLNSSGALPRKSLCIKPGHSAWCLYVDVTCLSYDGNVIDAAVLASLGALRNTRLPRVWYDEDSSQTLCSSEDSEKAPLALLNAPLLASFGIFEQTHLLADPAAFESVLLDSHISIGVSLSPEPGRDSRIIFLRQNGRIRATTCESGSQVSRKDAQVVQFCIERAQSRCQQLFDLLIQAERERPSKT
ncbi:hypothetical protein IE53DRAFT_384236 [Violaceomyces palustris]|uniref:Uncharacterized protein n=1 Tax=Violaceomyces palustris TaxID=1673888 RepID=A0ACD0P5S8_9BASI|nr:hypothetical protein IE53DRAFT_384236 [Violaceomyces palustris]